MPKLAGAHKARVMSTTHSHLELVLVGATLFVLYPIHHCPCLLNQELTVQADAVLTPLIRARKEDGDRDERMVLEYIACWVHIGRRLSLSGPSLSVSVWELQEFKYTEWYAWLRPTPQKYLDDRLEFLRMLGIGYMSMAMYGSVYFRV